MVANLARELASIRHGDHLCIPYDSAEDCDAAIAPFLAEGLARGERCVYVLESRDREALVGMLAAAGVNAARALDRGALCLLTPDETYFRSGSFDPDDTLALVDELVSRALADGFTGLRASGEIETAARHAVAWGKVFSYEARFNERFAKRPVIGLCRYHGPASPTAMVADALRTHPTAIVGGRVCRNPYYEVPDLALAADGEAARLEWRLHQLRQTSARDVRTREMIRSLADEMSRLSAASQFHACVQKELEHAVHMRDQFLDLVIQELSGPVAGLAVELQALPDTPGALGRHFKRLGALVEGLKEVSSLTNRAALVVDDVDLADVARQVTLRNRERLAALGSAVSFKSEARILGRWDRRRIEQLVANLLLNAGKRGRGQPIDVQLRTDGAMAIVAVTYRGAPRPELGTAPKATKTMKTAEAPAATKATLATQELTKGSAEAGLWVSREIISALGGSMGIAHKSGHGDADPADEADTFEQFFGAGKTGGGAPVTVITVELPRSGPRPRSVAHPELF